VTADTGLGTGPDYVFGISRPPLTYSLTTCDLMSQRITELSECIGPVTHR
jgi:hypothetical protein